MTFTRTRLLLFIALSLLMSMPAAAATKRRAVQHPSLGTTFQATVQGVVTDAVTGAPVRAAVVRFGRGVDATTETGNFKIANTTVSGIGTITVSRSGYVTSEQSITTPGTHNLTFRLVSKPTITVRLRNGSTRNVDFEESSFSYPQPFGPNGLVEKYCLANGTERIITVSEIKRMVGPSTKPNVAACCDRPLEQVRLELKNGETFDATYAQSCFGYPIAFGGREHVTGQYVSDYLADINEIIFP